MKKVLIVEDRPDNQDAYARVLGELVTIVPALTLEDGKRLFLEHPDIDAIVMDACVPGDRPTTQPLVQFIRQTYKGPIIAASGDWRYRQWLVRAGCDHEAQKWDVASKLKQVLGL